MKKNVFKFDLETLQFKDSSKNRRRITMVVTQLMSALLVAFILFLFMSYVSESPKEKKYQREHDILVEQYKILVERKQQTDKLLSELVEKDRKIHRAIMETDPLEDSVFMTSYDIFTAKDPRNVLNENQRNIENIKLELEKQNEIYNTILSLLRKKQDELKNIPAIQPVKNSNFNYTVYGFGNRIDPVYKTQVFHNGVDFAAPAGTPVYATADGTVQRADNTLKGLGNHVRINHGNGYETVFAHLETTNVFAGKIVKRGDVIGTVGSTGKSFVPHLHYEVIYKGKNTNPANFFLLDMTPEDFQIMQVHASRVGLCLD